MGNENSTFSNSTIGNKQRGPLSPTLFCLCIDDLEQMIVKFEKKGRIEEVVVKNVVIMPLSYVDGVTLSTNTLEEARAYEGIGYESKTVQFRLNRFGIVQTKPVSLNKFESFQTEPNLFLNRLGTSLALNGSVQLEPCKNQA